jgi:protein-S-isoprenylcysteine O-methyltransferase Ste14
MLDDNGFQMSHSTKVLPPVYFLVAVVTMTGLHFLAPFRTILHPPLTYPGTLLIIIGFSVVIWAATAFGRFGTPIKPFEESTHLVTGGMYRATRNPMYLGMVVILLGIAVLFGTISPLIPIPFFVWLIQTNFIRHEEAALERTFGVEYMEYKRSVRRWL